jgi:hypothetical protein
MKAYCGNFRCMKCMRDTGRVADVGDGSSMQGMVPTIRIHVNSRREVFLKLGG